MIIQRMIPNISHLKNLLDLLVNVPDHSNLLSMQNSNFEKVFIFEVTTKLYLVTDTLPVNMNTFAMC